MSETACLWTVTAALVALASGPAAHAKLPAGSSFEACGASGCVTASGADARELELRLIEAAIEHGAATAPTGAREFIRVDLQLGTTPDRASVRDPLRALRRPFPAVFVPAARSLGVARGADDYAWVSLRPAQMRAYARLSDDVEPFPAAPLAELDPAALAASGPAGDTFGTEESSPTPLIVGILALGSVGVASLLLIVRRLRRRPRRARDRTAAASPGEPASTSPGHPR